MIESLLASRELTYVVLLFALFVVPRLLQRARLPSAVTSFGLGAAAGLGLGWFHHDPTIGLLSTFGIVALFLFAGLEVDLDELRENAGILVQHVVVRVALVGAGAWVVAAAFGLEARAALLVSLALFTPSTGFILDSLHTWGLSQREQFWIRSKAVATELVALAVLFVTLQSATVTTLSVSAAVLIGMIVFLPLVFRAFAKLVAPVAPRSEFAFLLMVALICATVTRELGVYYLVGAFVVGMAADRFRERMPAMASESMLHAVQSFASFFVPFYFFHAGLELRASDFQPAALVAGLVLLAVMLPLRLLLVALHRRLTLGESVRDALRVGVPMLPTLVFGLVIVGILRERFELPAWMPGALVIYTLGSTLVPGLALRLPPPEFETFRVPPLRSTVPGADPRVAAEAGSAASAARARD